MFNPMSKIKTEKIEGKQVQIYLLPALEGIKMARDLAEIIIPTAGTFYQGFVEGNVNFENLAITLISELDKIDIEGIISRLLRDVAIDNQAIEFDTYFMANYGELIQIVAFALKENFSSFFVAKGLFEKYLPKAVETEQVSPAE